MKAKEASKRWPQSAGTFELLGWASLETDRIEEAKEAFEKALIINPTLASVREKLEDLQ